MKTYKNSTKRIAGLGVVCLLSFLLSSCLKDHNTYYAPPVAYVSFIQASPDEQPLDFYLNNNKVNWAPLIYGDEIDYFRAYTGTRTVNIYNENSMTKIFSDTIHLDANIAYSLFFANTTAHPETILLTDSISRPASGNAGIRFVDVSPDAPAVDLFVQSGGSTLGSNISYSGSTLVANKSYKGFTSFFPILGNKSYTFQVLQHGTSTVLATLSNVNLSSGVVYTIWFHGLSASANNTDKLGADIITNAYYY